MCEWSGPPGRLRARETRTAASSPVLKEPMPASAQEGGCPLCHLITVSRNGPCPDWRCGHGARLVSAPFARFVRDPPARIPAGSVTHCEELPSAPGIGTRFQSRRRGPPRYERQNPTRTSQVADPLGDAHRQTHHVIWSVYDRCRRRATTGGISVCTTCGSSFTSWVCSDSCWRTG